MQRLLDHLKEAALYSGKDLESATHTLNLMQAALKRGKERYSPHLLTLLGNRLGTCHKILDELQASLDDLSPELVPVHEKLISILRSISAANTRRKVLHRFPHSCDQKLTRNLVSDIRCSRVPGTAQRNSKHYGQR